MTESEDRAAFEAWFKATKAPTPYDLLRDEITSDDYYSPTTQALWEAWQAASVKVRNERALLARLGEQQPVAQWQWRWREGGRQMREWKNAHQDCSNLLDCPVFEYRALYAHPPAEQPVAQGEREAFEAWASRNFVQAPPTAIDFTQRPWSLMWLAWQASRSSAQGAAQVPAWQPIETAPKDGQCLLWVDTDDGGEVMKLRRDREGNWLYEGEPTFCHSFYINPTHWQPLPAAPSPAGERTSTEGE